MLRERGCSCNELGNLSSLERTARGLLLPGPMTLRHLLAQHRAARRLLQEVVAVPGDRDLRASLGDLLLAHFREEEELVHRLASLLPSETGPLPVILEEHRTIREILSPDSGGAQVRRLASLLPSHFAKEEEVLFPFAEANLATEEGA